MLEDNLDHNESKSATVYRNSNLFHNSLVILMLLSAFLGSTIFDTAQIAVELVLFILLAFGMLYIKLKVWDVLLLTIFFVVFAISFFLNDFVKIALNFKIYGLCILTYIYFSKIQFYPKRLMFLLHAVNIFLIIHQYVTGHFIVPSAWFFGQYQEYANSRPVGVFLTPHASSFFIAVCTLYFIVIKRKYFKGLFFFLLNLMTSSLTGLIAFLAQFSLICFNYSLRKFPILRINFGWVTKILIIGIPLVLLAIFRDQFIELLKANPYSRSYSLEIILNQLFDSRFFSDIFKFYSRDYQTYTIGQENVFADYANEIGFVKVFIEAGFVLGVLLLYTLIKNLKYFGMFIFVSLFHYSFVINMPFMLFLMLQYNYEMVTKQQENKIGKGKLDIVFV